EIPPVPSRRSSRGKRVKPDSRYRFALGAFVTEPWIAGLERAIEDLLLLGVRGEERAEQRLHIRRRALIAQPAEKCLKPDTVFNANPKSLAAQLLDQIVKRQ